MPPRRAARAAAQEPFEELDSNAARPPARRTAAAAAKANANKPAPTRRAPAATKQAPTRAAGRTTRKRVVQDSESEEEKEEGDEDEAEGPARAGSDAASDDDDDDSEDDEPVKPRARGKTLAAGRQASAARRAARVSAASSIAKSEDAEDDDDEEEEEAEEPVKSARASRARAAAATTSRTGRGKKTAEPVLPLSPSPTPSVAATASEDDSSEEEEEEASEEEEGASAEEFEPAPTRKRGAAAEKRVSLAPASAKAAARRRSVLPTPDPESSAAEEDATETEGNADEDDEEDEDEDEDDDATPQPPPVRKVRGAAKGKGKARPVVASSDEGDEEEEAEAEAKVEPTPPNGEAVPPSPTPSNRGQVRSRSSTPVPTPAVAAEAAAAVAQPPPSPVKPSPPTALTASALASIARQAAIDHAAHAVQRAEEMKGKPRLVIHQLVLENFKSYKGRAIIGPFHKSFSAIVGPNGSGKSNTIDALLFVFGFRANKMRQGKFSELIHNSGAAAPAGSSTAKEGEDNGDEEDDEGFFDPEEYDSDDDEAYRKGGSKGKGKGKGKAGKKRATERYAAGGCEYATVEIWFREIIESADSVDDWNVVPNSGLVVARTVRRDNTTRYTVNGKSASPGEVKQLLLGRGIDLTHNRFLILQGEVESIAQMKPKGATEHEEGLLEYLEDIIGTNRYEKLIEEAAVDVERLGDERQVQMNRVKLVEKEKGALEARKKAADAYIRDQLELVRLQNQLYQRHAHQAGADRLLYEEQAAEAKAELDAELERQKVDRERYEADSAAYESTKQHLKEIEEAANAFAKDLATFEKAKVQLTVQKKAADTKYSKLKKQLEEDKHAAQQAQSDIRDHTDTLDKLISGKDKFKDELEQEQAALTKVMDGLRDKIEGFSLEIEQHQKSLAPWHEQIEAKQNEIKIATQQLEDLRGKSAQIQADIERIEEEIEADRVAAKEKAQELKALHASRKEMDERIEQARTRVQKEKATENKQRAAVSNAREKSVEAKASQQASQSKGHVLSSVLKLKEQGRLPGFHGRLGDLGRIDDKYDVAISTAAASGLESLIVDTRETAEAIFDHLRKHNIGRASCIALDRFGKLDLSPIRTPANTNRLFDLVTPKEQMYAPAFRHILKDTLVAPSWDVGQPVSTGKVDGQRWRVVTLDGNIAEKSGAAQVGGSRPIRGKMSSKIQADDVSPQQLAKLEADEKAAVVKLDEVVELSKAAETDLRSLQKELAQIDAAIPKIEMDLEANKQDGEQKAELLAELRSQSKPNAGDVKRIAQLEKAIEALDGELETLRGKASKYEEKISALQGKIEEVGGLKLRSQKAKVSDLQEQIRHNETRLVKAKTERAKAEKDLAKSTKAIEANSAKAEELEAEIADLRKQLAATEQEAEPIRQTVEQAQAGVEDGREQLANLKAELDEQEDAIIEFKKAEAELKGAFAEQEKLLRESTRIFEYWSAKIGELQLPDFEMLEPEEGDDDEEVEKPPRVEEILRQLEPDEIASVDLKKLKGQIALIEERLERNNADLAVLQEYKRRDEEFRKRAEEFESVSRQWDAAKTAVTELRNERLVQFMQGFGIISNKLKEMYQMITLGGNAELELYDSADPFSEGILFSVMPPKKSWKNISNLSGGEKTLSSLALVFALHTYKPTPIYLLDEVDAALDFRNVSIVANYIKARCAQQAQFIVISLRNNLFELANRLVGVYKVENCTRSVAIDNTDLAAIADVDPAGKA